MAPVIPAQLGRFFEDFEVGTVYQHPFGRTISEADSTWFTYCSDTPARSARSSWVYPRAKRSRLVLLAIQALARANRSSVSAANLDGSTRRGTV